jgi:hypothetical protein
MRHILTKINLAFEKFFSKFTPQKLYYMRYVIIILSTMLLGACGNKLGNLKYASQKVKQTVDACTKSTINACPGAENSSVTDNEQTKEDDNTRASTSWDTHMMLW